MLASGIGYPGSYTGFDASERQSDSDLQEISMLSCERKFIHSKAFKASRIAPETICGRGKSSLRLNGMESETDETTRC